MKRKTLLLIPLLIMLAVLLYCWTAILTTRFSADWRHYAGLALYVPLVFLFFRSTAIAAVATGLYLLLATFNLLAITVPVMTFGLRLGPVSAPPIQGISLGLLILFSILNFHTLSEAYLDHKEGKPIG